jgi:hypothetical protein
MGCFKTSTLDSVEGRWVVEVEGNVKVLRGLALQAHRSSPVHGKKVVIKLVGEEVLFVDFDHPVTSRNSFRMFYIN